MNNTSSYNNFLDNINRLRGFLKISEHASSNSKDMDDIKKELARKAVAEGIKTLSPEEMATNFAEQILDIQEKAWNEYIHKYHRLRWEMTIVNIVTISEIYLMDIIREILRSNKNFILDNVNENDNIKYTELLKFSSLDDIIESMIDTKINQIMKKYIKGIIKFIEKSCNETVLINKDIDDIQLLWDTRNILVHHNGIIDDYYAKKYSKQRGDTIQVDNSFVDKFIDFLSNKFLKVDESAQKILQISIISTNL